MKHRCFWRVLEEVSLATPKLCFIFLAGSFSFSGHHEKKHPQTLPILYVFNPVQAQEEVGDEIVRLCLGLWPHGSYETSHDSYARKSRSSLCPSEVWRQQGPN